MNEEEDKKIIQQAFDELWALSIDRLKNEEERQGVRLAFHIAKTAHHGMRRRSGEPYIMHPIAVARIVVEDIGLAYKSIVASLLHDVVEDTPYTLDEVRNTFGAKVASIVDGLTKVEGIFDKSTSLQAENFKRILRTMNDDIRVILIKLADRLHNMRTIDSMPERKRMKVVGETMYFFVPLANRLGLYNIKTELENISLKISEPDKYYEIKQKLDASAADRLAYIDRFVQPLKEKLSAAGIRCEITGQTKSVYSVWKKMNAQNVPFEEIYDIFAVHIIFDMQTGKNERAQCWEIYQLITDIYRSRTDLLRDWSETPKLNGYEALHCTLIGQLGSWVDVQIRSVRMDEIAQRGVVAHWKYKDATTQDSELDKWLQQVKEMFESPDNNTLEFLEYFRHGMLDSEVYIYTPKGEAKALPKGATVLDFAYYVHTAIGNKAIAGKVNHKLEPLNYVLHGGDQVEVITAETQRPQGNWLHIAVTPKAKMQIKDALKSEIQSLQQLGLSMLDEHLKAQGIAEPVRLFKKLVKIYSLNNKYELFVKIGAGQIDLSDVDAKLQYDTAKKPVRYWGLQFILGGDKQKTVAATPVDKKAPYLLEENVADNTLSYLIAPCCEPIPGDDITGFLDENGKVTIHKKKCPIAYQLAAQHGDRIVQAQWRKHVAVSSLAHLELRGVDRLGVLNDITHVITVELNVNIRRINLEAHDGIFECHIDIYVHDTNNLDDLIEKMRKIKGIESIRRKEA
ncbi:MAG: RelA/SpoT family protein [Prevotellaceae bacterium]|jgi:GTP pyrophosphokinase|nr:RelA/SpoT family protein [Prevotellaceae bacterium]